SSVSYRTRPLLVRRCTSNRRSKKARVRRERWPMRSTASRNCASAAASGVMPAYACAHAPSAAAPPSKICRRSNMVNAHILHGPVAAREYTKGEPRTATRPLTENCGFSLGGVSKVVQSPARALYGPPTLPSIAGDGLLGDVYHAVAPWPQHSHAATGQLSFERLAFGDLTLCVAQLIPLHSHN